LVLAPDGSAIENFKDLTLNKAKLQAYQLMAKKKNELQRTELNKDKTGVILEGLVAVNPATEKPMPLWTADYIMGDYGSGAIMAVPSHDERDFEFALKNGLEIKKVVSGEEKILAFLNFSFLNNPKKALVSLNEKFKLEPFFLSKKGLVGGSKERENNENPYGWVIGLSDEGELGKYIKLLKKFLKQDLWSEVVRNKHTTFIFRDAVLKSDTDAPRIKLKFEVAIKKLVRRKGFDPRTKSLLKILKHKIFVPEFIAWTLPIGKIRECICFAGCEGTMINSAFLEGMSVARAKEKTIDWLQQKRLGDRKISFRLRDWLISRQRYWGAPIPIIYCPKCGTVPVPEKDLPVKLPSRVEFMPTGESPLKKLDSFLKVRCPICGGEAEREVDTMDTFVCSSWYYLRFADPKNSQEFAGQEKIRRFLPVDLYVGGAEHAVLHLLYSRFFVKALKDAGFIDFDEPFLKLRNQGMILGPDHNKMSKSKGNVINPDDIIKEWGADSLRMYEMFMGPLEDMKPWDTKGIAGVRRFLEKIWWLREKVVEKEEERKKLLLDKNYMDTVSLLHFTLNKVTGDIENLCFNTAISQLMILVNRFKNKTAGIIKSDFSLILKALAPFAPHLTEELWESLGEKESIFLEDWPAADPKLIRVEEKELAVQVNGKKRDVIRVSVETTEAEVRKQVMASNLIAKHLGGRPVKKLIYVPGKIVNLVV
jgi:leucyl-tRNA synthetase